MTRRNTDVEGRVTTAGVSLEVISVAVIMMGMGVLAVGCADTIPAAPATSDVLLPSQLPSGYALQLDRANRDRADFTVRDDNGDLVVETGPAGILYRPDDADHVVAATEALHYRVRGRFTEVGAPMGHREGFGVFVGGQRLGGQGQRYVYFMVRGDGRYLVKQRDGDATMELSQGWQPSDAVRVPTSEGGEVTNELAVEVDGGELHLLCNGQPVMDVMVDDMDTRGVVGLRVNHNLHVRIGDFGLDREW